MSTHRIEGKQLRQLLQKIKRPARTRRCYGGQGVGEWGMRHAACGTPRLVLDTEWMDIRGNEPPFPPNPMIFTSSRMKLMHLLVLHSIMKICLRNLISLSRSLRGSKSITSERTRPSGRPELNLWSIVTVLELWEDHGKEARHTFRRAKKHT